MAPRGTPEQPEQGTEGRPWLADGVLSDRQSVTYRLSNGSPRTDRDSFYESMFRDDVINGIVPFAGSFDGSPMFLTTASSSDVLAMFSHALRRGGMFGRQRERLTSQLATFTQHLTQDILFHGQATYEVALLQADGGNNVGFEVGTATNARFLVGTAWQLVPAGAVRINTYGVPSENTTEVQVVRLDTQRLVRVRLPKQYRRLTSGFRALRTIAAAVPPFALQNFGPGGEVRVEYDLSEYKAVQERAVASVTRSCGWNARGLLAESISGFYSLIRHLRFEQFKLDLRNVALHAVNDILKIAGNRLGFSAKVRIVGCPTEGEIVAAYRDLREGRLDYSGIQERFALHNRRVE